MPAIAGPFDELFSSNKLNEDVKTFGLGSENADVKISSTSLFSLVALAEDGGVCHGGSAERGIAARHLRRALSSKCRLGNIGVENRNDESENILLARHESSGEDPSTAKRRLKDISNNVLNIRGKSDSVGDGTNNGTRNNNNKRTNSISNRTNSFNDASKHPDSSTIEGTPLRVDFASLDLPSELLDTPTEFGDEVDDLGSSDSDWIQPLSLSKARQLASSFNLDAFSAMKDGVKIEATTSSSTSSTSSPASIKNEASSPKLSTPSSTTSSSVSASAPHLLPLWIACDGNDNESVILLGSQKLTARDTSLTTVCSRVVTTIDARADVDRLLQEFREEEEEDDGVNRRPLQASAIRVSAFYLQRMSVLEESQDYADESVFNFSSDGTLPVTSAASKRGKIRQMVIEVNCLWDSPVGKQLMQPPCVTDKMLDCQLHLTIGGSPKEDSLKLGESQALIFSLYEDMKKLEAFLRGLTSGGKELTWFPMMGEKEDDDAVRKQRLLTRVDELLKSEKERSGRTASTSATPTGNETSIDATEGGVSNRNLDFVAKLWDILKCCGSSMELQECLNRAVFRIVNASSIDELPTVFSISSSNIAQRIVATQESLLKADETMDSGRKGSCRDDNPLIGLNPLLLLAELGIDKLRQEYHSFSTVLLPQLPLEKLVSGSSIYSNTNRSSSKFLDPKDRSLTSFHRLVISHYVVDSLVQIKTFFPSVNLEEAALKMAGVLRKQPLKNMGDFKTMSLKISLMEDVKTDQLKNPTSWMMTTTMGGGGSGGGNSGESGERVETVHVSPFKTLPIIRTEKNGSGNFVLTRISSFTHALGR